MLTVIFLGILGAIISAIIGTYWYSMKTPMGKVHMQSIGFLDLTKEEQNKKIKEAMPNMWKSYAMQMGLSFLTSVFIAFVTIQNKAGGAPSYMVYGYLIMIWAGFVLPVIGSALIWGNCDRKIVLKKFVYDNLSNLVTYFAIAFVCGLFVL